jgi:phosphoribosylanthranilate isomerase
MTWVKICGMTNLEDALVAVEAGADAVGFVFYEKSPRCMTVEAAREIVAKLPEGVEKVGVFYKMPVEQWVQVVLATGFTAVQHYMPLEPDVQSHQLAITKGEFEKLPKFFLSFPMSLLLEAEAPLQELGADLKHFRDAPGLHLPREGIFDTFLLDSGGARSPGGSGKTFDWHRVIPMVEKMKENRLKAVVAGGLRPENVVQAMGILKPWGVDVVTGVEARPGKKDPEKVRAFVRAVREMDRKGS